MCKAVDKNCVRRVDETYREMYERVQGESEKKIINMKSILRETYNGESNQLKQLKVIRNVIQKKKPVNIPNSNTSNLMEKSRSQVIRFHSQSTITTTKGRLMKGKK